MGDAKENSMKSKPFIIFLLLSAILLMHLPVYAQYFGKNKVQYKDFEWFYIQSEHFNVYYTQGGYNIATYVAQVAEKSYQSLHKDFRYELVDRIKILVYNSHNDFGQTNVDMSPPEESVGGFTEFFKNRVVIPYEGEWENFRHVIHHEVTHAVMMQMLYGSGYQSVVSGLTQSQMPLWFIEGLAEYESRGWDIESDMYMRDATVSGYVPPVDYLYAYMAYKGGQSVLKYISDRYGPEKIGEILGKIKLTRNMRKALEESIGLDTEELTDRWHLYLKRSYWPDIANRKEPSEFSQEITDHEKDRNFINTSPAISHRGDKVVYMSDKDGYFDVYMASTIDKDKVKKLVHGQRAGDLEELHWLRGPAFAWSPDDRYIAFSAKAGAQDALHIVNVRNGDMVNTYKLGYDAIYNPSWSPNGDEIAFMGVKDGQSDICVFNRSTGETRKITDDLFSNVEPSWSPDGSTLLFASDRGDYLDDIPADLSPNDFDIKNYNIYEINVDGTGIQKIISGPYLNRTPLYSPDGTKIVYSSNRTGVSNIYIKDLATGNEWPITNAITGVFIPTWGGQAQRMAFVSFYNGGYDIYIMKNPLDIAPDAIVINKTQFVKNQEKEKAEKEPDQIADNGIGLKQKTKEMREYRNYVFDQDFADGYVQPDEYEDVFLDSSQYINSNGKYKVHDYDLDFSADIVSGNVGYNQFFGTLGYTTMMFSDVMGNHRLLVAANLFGDFRNADYAFSYYYLPKRLDIGATIYHNSYFFWSASTGWLRDRYYGLSLQFSNPFDRYTRLSYTMSLSGINREYLDLPDEYVNQLVDAGYVSPLNRYFVLNNLTFTKDNTDWGYTGPVNGARWGVGVTYSPRLGESGIDFTTVRADYRKYFRVFRDYSFAFRGASGFSEGVHPQKFFLGGMYNWINYDYRGGIRVDHVEDIYFASFEMPLRGADFYQLVGNRFALANMEFRFPLIRQILMGFPLPLYLSNVGGAIFSDWGFAWDKHNADDLKPFVKAPNGFIRTKDAFASFGFGVRMNLGIFLLRFDLAWPTDLYVTEKEPHVLWSIGADL